VTGSGSKGGASSMGLSGSSSGFSTGCGSWYISIEEYSLWWIFQGIGTRGSTGGWTGVGGCVVASLGGLLGGNGGRTGSGFARGFGVDAEGYEGGEKLGGL